MAGVTNEMLYELARSLHADLDSVGRSVAEVKAELGLIRSDLAQAHQNLANIGDRLCGMDRRLERIADRLDPIQPAH
jgi:septation ring formation regulator EzrA